MKKITFKKHDTPGGYIYTAGAESGPGYRFVIYLNAGGRNPKYKYMLIVRNRLGEVRFFDYSLVRLRDIAQKFQDGSAEIN